jgi:hypothetical protein
MSRLPLRLALLGTAAALAAPAFAQGQIDPQACIVLESRLAGDSALGPDLRSDIEQVIAAGDVERCHLVFTRWETEGRITRESLAIVATERETQRMIVQQEVEVAAQAAVYQPPVEVTVESGAPEVTWSLPRQNVTIDEQAPQIRVVQGQPQIRVEVPQPRVMVMIPEPEVVVTWPDSAARLAAVMPQIDVRIPDPVVSVVMPDPIVVLTIGGATPENLVQLDDGRFAPRGASESDLEPRIALRQQEAVVTPARDAEEPAIVFNRAEPVITVEAMDPEIMVDVIGEPEIVVVASDDDMPATRRD